jgi:hypothetical protein
MRVASIPLILLPPPNLWRTDGARTEQAAFPICASHRANVVALQQIPPAAIDKVNVVARHHSVSHGQPLWKLHLQQ